MKVQPECTQCGACVDVCPVFKLFGREQYSPKAKQVLLRKGWVDDGILEWEKMLTLAGHCTSCERCKSVCAVGLSVPEALAKARARHPKWQQYAWREWINHGGALWPIASRLAPLVPQKVLPEDMANLHANALAMKAPPKPEPLLRLMATHPKTLTGKNVVLFSGCTALRLRPAWLEKTRDVLQALGANILSGDGFTCCGGTHEHAGMFDASVQAAQKNIRVWKELGKPSILTLCASCLHSLRQYQHLSHGQSAEDMAQWSEALMPLSTLIEAEFVESLSQTTISYHSPCHWGKVDSDLQLLKKVLPQLQKGSFPCCGFGGILKMLNPKLSKELAKKCWQGLEQQEHTPSVILTGCSGCTMQLNAYAQGQRAVYHWLDVMDRA